MNEITVNKNEYDAAAHDFISYLNAFAKANKPVVDLDSIAYGDRERPMVTIDNSGPFDFQVDVTGCDADFIHDLFFGLEDEPMGHVAVDYVLPGCDIQVRLFFLIDTPKVVDGIATFQGRWTGKPRGWCL